MAKEPLAVVEPGVAEGRQTDLTEALVVIRVPIYDISGNFIKHVTHTFEGEVIAADPEIPGSVKQDLIAAVRTFAAFYRRVS